MYVNCGAAARPHGAATTGGALHNRADTVLEAAIYDPATNTWTAVAADPVPRNYHSSAFLLPDGRVTAFGYNPGDGSFELRISVYEPPYLFKGPRPTLSGVPDEAHYGDQLTFPVDSASTIRWAQLVRPMSVTHQMDTNARLVDLPIVVDGGLATVTIPSNPNLLPPGPYMLNITDSKGVPSAVGVGEDLVRFRLLIPLAALAIVATGVGVAVAAMGPEAHKPTRLQRQLQAQVETPAGKPKSGLDPARQDQTSLAEAARAANDGIGRRGSKPARGVKLAKTRRAAKDVLPATGLSNGCAAGYGAPGAQCLPRRAPGDKPLTCSYASKLFPKGIEVTGRDRLKLDTDRDGTACDPGDRGAR